MGRISLLAIFLATGVCLSLLLAKTPQTGEPRRAVVVELFTSQGCSSCPAADAFVRELPSLGLGRTKVLPLTFHVSYWDDLGWKDPFSSPDATRLQHGYADLLGLATVYTPQMVVEGRLQVVGSDRSEVEQALGSARSNRDGVPVALAVGHGRAQMGAAAGNKGRFAVQTEKILRHRTHPKPLQPDRRG